MHELSIAQSVLEIVRQHVPQEQSCDVRGVRVRAGRLSGVVPESLAFCFEALVRDTDLDRARLVIEAVPISCRCAGCDASFEAEDPTFLCPACGRCEILMSGGGELHIVDIELADSPAEVP